ncbi:hypothetical protein RF11_04123 [Thelohanellus kitauei]|uniref:CCHC-type domain-containing protein n=1 Tax=Thelohanellus kitauei TaxID=669202 RepID=A0A0C2MN99_THEKT|nr:hypothetical protein RF11_04123 [Thelohanellus kitauei]
MSLLNSVKNFSEGDFPDWCWKFERCMKALGKFKEEELSNYLPVFLDGLAIKYFMSLPCDVQSSYGKAKEMLISRFSQAPEKSLLELDSMAKGPIEDFVAFGIRVKQLVDLSYPTFGVEQREVLYLQHFLKKIEPDMAQSVVCKSSVTTIDEAISICMKTSIAKSLYTARPCNAIQVETDDRFDKLSNEIKVLSEKLNTISMVNQPEANAIDYSGSRPQTRATIQCYFCKKIGHYKRHCRSYKNYMNRSDNDRSKCSYFTFTNDGENLPCIEALLNNVRIQGILDTGSSISLLSFHIYIKFFNNMSLFQDTQTIRTAGSTPLNVEGLIELKVNFKNKCTFLRFYVVRNLIRACIFGIDFMKKFGINLKFSDAEGSDQSQEKVAAIVQSSPILEKNFDDSEIPDFNNKSIKLPDVPNYLVPLVREYTNLFGILPGTTNKTFHKIDLLSDQVCKERPRQVPIHYRHFIEQKINELLENDIIHQVNHYRELLWDMAFAIGGRHSLDILLYVLVLLVFSDSCGV